MEITNENRDDVAKKKLRICHNKGFHIKFKNGWTVSVQFGWGNYCDNHNNDPKEIGDFGNSSYASDNAEIWAWKDQKYYPKEPLGYRTPEQILQFINKIQKKK